MICVQFFTKVHYIAPEILELVSLPNLLNAKIYKKDARKAMMKNQSSGNAEEWQSGNFMLYNIPGLRRSPRNVIALNCHLISACEKLVVIN